MSIRFVQIETTTVCNQRCNFCPVSNSKRPKQTMSMGILDKILNEISVFPVEAIYLNGFNEPTYDKELVAKVERIRAAGYKKRIHLNSNGSGLEPELTDKLIEAEVTSFSINISTVDEARYRKTRGTNDLQKVFRNLPYLLIHAREKGIEVNLVILGFLDKLHLTDIRKICESFYPLPQELLICPIVNYACDHRTIAPNGYRQALRGCAENRHKQWLHCNADGQVIFCCQDYNTAYPIGDVTIQSVIEIFNGETVRKFRGWVEGDEQAPEDFLCRFCVKAIDENNYDDTLRSRFCHSCVLPADLGEESACRHCAIGHAIVDPFSLSGN